jgi:hypothetical protein
MSGGSVPPLILPALMSTLGPELSVHASARDSTGVKQVRSGIHAVAEKFPGWVPMRHLADACYARLRGELQVALASVEQAIADAETAFSALGRAPASVCHQD